MLTFSIKDNLINVSRGIMSYSEMMRFRTLTAAVFFIFICASCSQNTKKNVNPPGGNEAAGFVALLPESTGVDFANHVLINDFVNYFTYPYVYNGGGVAVGDINNDGWPDLYFTSNEHPNQLYVNLGNMKFTNVSNQAGVVGKKGWSTGAVMIDINNDGWLDIYVCYSGGYTDPAVRANQLFINNGDLTFTESAKEYGLDDTGSSIQAYFFDYDKDGDLDMYLLNHPLDFWSEMPEKTPWLPKPGDEAHVSDQFYRNNGNNTFTNVTNKAGIRNHAWGLSAAIHDFNGDGWEDIYVANDFIAPDLLWINNRNGTFTESMKDYFGHISRHARGCDMADIDNDGLLDLFVADIAPVSDAESKRVTQYLPRDIFQKMLDIGCHYQYGYNTLQRNNGSGTFSEIAFLAGVAKTGFSWAPLFADFDNDGFQDLYVTNGVSLDMLDKDIAKEVEGIFAMGLIEKREVKYSQVKNLLPRVTSRNFAYRNNGNFTFTEHKAWNSLEAVNGSSAVYVDLDRDGDIDIVVNNFETKATILENKAGNASGYKFIRIKLIGPEKNINGWGAKVTVYNLNKMQTQIVQPARGFQSCMESELHFGIGNDSLIDLLRVEWPDGVVQELENIACCQYISISHSDETFRVKYVKPEPARKIFTEAAREHNILHLHKENNYDDFEKQPLLPHKQSEHGPFMSAGDVNGDRMEDFFIGGSAGYSGTLYLQHIDGTFYAAPSQPWEKEKASEDMASLLFDADNDGDLDLYVVSGGYEFEAGSPFLQDRLYLNDGKGNFTRDINALPVMFSSGMSVAAGDFDKDGDYDLFVGGRVVPGEYPDAPRSYLLRNNGGKFTDVTEQHDPLLSMPGMVTDAVFTDYDNDGNLDLAMVGEWMPLLIFKNEQGKFTRTLYAGMENTRGWWFSIAALDADNDGNTDFALGNIGMNSCLTDAAGKPLHLYYYDFDGNGAADLMLTRQEGDKHFPVIGLERFSSQFPSIGMKMQSHKTYAAADVQQLFSKEKAEEAFKLSASEFRSGMMLNKGNGSFIFKPFPPIVQSAPVRDIVVYDVNLDGIFEIILAGNYYGVDYEMPRHDAGVGRLLAGDGSGNYYAVSLAEAGFPLQGNVSDLQLVRIAKQPEPVLLVANNNAVVQAFRINVFVKPGGMAEIK